MFRDREFFRNFHKDRNHETFRLILIYIVLLGFAEASLKLPTKRVIKHDPEALVGMTLQDQREVPLFYDTFFPVIFELQVPTWNISNLRLEVPKNLTGSAYLAAQKGEHPYLCNSTSARPPAPNATNIDLWESTLCPIKKKFDELLEIYAREMKTFETFNASVTKLDSHFSSCHEIKPHFSNHIIDDLEIELYLVQVILDCPMADVIHHKIQVSNPDKFKYSEVFRIFMETYILPRFRLIGFPKFAIPTNTLLTLHTTHLLNYLLDSFQWTTSINTCNSQRIPRLLVPQDTLKATLIEVQEKLAKEKEDFRLTIPIQDLSNYYKMKLADCVTTTSNSYIIRILVPLTKASSRYKLTQVRAIPFLSKDTESSKTMICHHKNAEGTFIVDYPSNTVIDTTTCQEAELCRVPPVGERMLFSRCIHSTIQNDSVKMLEFCRMSCVPIDPNSLPYIKRTRSDQFVIAGKSSAEIAIVCKREEDKPTIINNIPEDIGSIIITIPCGCHIRHRQIKYEINGACEFTLEIRPVHPKGYSYDSLLEHYFHHHLENISNHIVKSIVNQSQGQLFDVTDGGADAVVMKQIAGYPIWPLYIAYSILIIGVILLVLGFYVLRNVYVRVGQLEMSTAMRSMQQTRYAEPQFNRNAPVTFNARRGSGSGNPSYVTNESVY